LLKYLHQKDHSTADWARWRNNTTVHRGPSLGLALGPAPAGAGPDGNKSSKLDFKLPWTVELRQYILAGNSAKQWLLIAVSHAVLYWVKRSISEIAAMIRQVRKINCWWQCEIERLCGWSI